MVYRNGLIFCICQGTCPSFKKMNVFEVMNYFRKEKLVDFVILHPQLCADDGDEFFKVLLENKNIGKIFIGGCDTLMQRKMFKEVFRTTGFNLIKHIPIDIRNNTTEEAISSITKIIRENK